MPDLQRRPVQSDPYNAETPMSALAVPLTPEGLFYVRNHFPVPALDAAGYRLTVDWQPSDRPPQTYSLAELQAMTRHTVVVTLECAGNGRTTLDPPPAGTPWAFGAVGTASFTGVPLRSLFPPGGLLGEVIEVLFVGADSGRVPTGETIPFGRSLTPGVAAGEDVLLAWAMNGRPLPPEHGYPLRLVVPRWYGVASVKWLSEIRGLRRPFDGYYQTDQYLYNGQAGLPDGTPVTTMRVRSVIAAPADGAALPAGPVEIAGTAWSGDGTIARVEVSSDGGASWATAELLGGPSEYAAVGWRLAWSPGPGVYELMARATDAAGLTQPLEPVWTQQGYGNNAAQRVRVVVQ
jgi:DMSO/TMAO reductase YedYZ molybdopterin-dependent catalytic subunit